MNYQYEFPRPAVSVDIVVFRSVSSAKHVLLIKRKNPPFVDQWALPGGFLCIDETLESAAARELREETGLDCDQLRQLKAYSAVARDPRGRVISVAFLADVPADLNAIAADDAKEVNWFPIDRLPPLAFDHAEIIANAIEASRR